jgi:hypothetical protein
MTATHELVVPKSIPITSPASVLLNLRLRSRKGDPSDPLEDWREEIPRRKLSCNAIVEKLRICEPVAYLRGGSVLGNVPRKSVNGRGNFLAGLSILTSRRNVSRRFEDFPDNSPWKKKRSGSFCPAH